MVLATSSLNLVLCMRERRRHIFSVVVILVAFLWLTSWYFDTLPYVYIHDHLVRRWQLHSPLLLGWLPAVMLFALALRSTLKQARLHEMSLSYDQLVKTLHRRFFSLSALALLCAAMSYGLFLLAQRAPVADQATMALDASQPPSMFLWMHKVKVEGAPLTQGITITRDRRYPSWTQLKRYTPLVARANSRHPIYFTESYSSNSSTSLNRQAVAKTGYVSLRLLPYSVRSAYKQIGLTVPLVAYVIEPSFVDLAPYLRVSAILLLVLGLAVMLRLLMTARIHQRKLEECWHHQHSYSTTKRFDKDVFPWSK